MTPVAVGEQLAGRYRLREVLGEGGCATVFAATDDLLDRDVAVKVWHDEGSELSNHPAEVRLAARLAHEGVVVVHDAGVDHGLPFLVMERVQGPSLSEELRDGPLERARACRLVAELCRTLAHVHRCGLVHSDVKPGNVLVAPGDRCTLTDFGVATPIGHRPRRNVVGTTPYLSPEQVKGLSATPATDVYAAGLVLLEVLTGAQAFPGATEEAAVARLKNPPYVPAHVPDDLRQLVHEMTAADPRDRPSAEDAARRLDRARRPDATHVLPALSTQWAPHRPSRVTLLVSGLALLAVAGLALRGESLPAGTPSPVPSPSVAAPVVPHPVAASPTTRPRKVVAPAPPAHVKRHHHGHGHDDG